jgi:predicted dehydrogenase
MVPSINRRQFLKQSSLGLGGTLLIGCAATRRTYSANEKLNIASVGTANRAAANIQGVSSQNIVALCDVDETALAAKLTEFPGARTYRDFRRMLEQKNIDAVLVSTPDHTHAVAVAWALQRGLPVYCEKPLTRTVSEARVLARLARRKGVATQMGNQIHASSNYRRVVELVQRGAIGPVREVHVWAAAIYGDLPPPREFPPVPPNLSWDLWLGPVQPRPYHPDYAPFKWRNWWHFGGGALADFGCHYMDLPHWALDLRGPLTVEAVEGPKPNPERPPVAMVVKYGHRARGQRPPVTLYWHQGGGDIHVARLPEKFRKEFRSGVLFIGDGGLLLANYTKHHLLPEEKFAGFTPPATFIADSPGHHEEWIRACKTGSPTLSNFDYAGALTEAVLLGNVAHRCACRLEWDASNCRVTNCAEAEQYVQHAYRSGWRI